MTSRIIHSGRLPDLRNDSTTRRRLAAFWRLTTDGSVRIRRRSSPAISSRSMPRSSSWIASAPILATKPSPNSCLASRYCSSERTCFSSRVVSPGSTTTYASKYSTRSSSRIVMSRSCPMRLGRPLKNQTWETGAASSMWPMRSRRTLERVTSTPHLSQTTPRCFMRLYLPHRHSQSVTGPKMRAQKRPSRSGLNVR